MMRAKYFYLVALAASVACATSSTNTNAIPHRNSNVLTAEEIAASGATDAYEAVSRLRPAFFRSRGQTTTRQGSSTYPMVYLDGQSYGNLASLRNIPLTTVRSITYYSSSDAMTKFGTGNVNGAIEVVTR